MITTNDSGLNLDHERMRAGFENSDGYKSRLLFKRGGSVFAENVPEDEYVDSGVQGAWKFWQAAWAAALANQPAPTVPASIDHDAFWIRVAACRDAKPGAAYRVESEALVRYVNHWAAHQPAQEQADETTPSVDHRNTHVLLHGYTAQQEPVASPQQSDSPKGGA